MKKGVYIYPALLISLLFVFGCGGVTKQTITPVKTDNVKYIPAKNPVRIEGVKKVCIFPFADYSHQQSFLEPQEWGGNVKIVEEVTDQLIAHGLSVAVQEDVNTMLADYEVIKPIKKKYLFYGTTGEENGNEEEEPGTPEYEMKKVSHGSEIKEELMSVIKKNKEREGKEKEDSSKPSSPVLQGATVGLTKEMVVDIGKELGVDLIIRGRIIEFGYKDTATFSPLYRGMIPVLLDSVKNVVFGADYYGYENDLEALEYMMVGSGVGYAIGHQMIKESVRTDTKLTGTFITREEKVKDVDRDAQGGIGAAAGGVSGLIASQHPKNAKRTSVIQIRIYAQDARTGEVLWSNRAEVEYTPKSNFSYDDIHPKVMFDQVIKQGVKSLMDSFFSEAEKVLTKETKS
jgi:hypothetical protein